MKSSKWEALLAAQLTEAGIPFGPQWPILAGRRWRADFIVTTSLEMDGGLELLVEVNGAGPSGHHGNRAHAASDAEKLSAAACLGYRVIVATGPQVASGEALEWIRCALGIGGDPEAVFAKKRAERTIGRHKRSPKNGKLPARVLAAIERARM